MTIGIVVIGRNEAAHLSDCFGALPAGILAVYADSGSSDDSVRLAQAAGADVIVLTAPPTLTAARGRNAGLARLLELAPDTDFVQMVDGDCILDAGWIAAAHATLVADDRAAAVCGQLRERYPEASIYNRLCNREWQVPPGEVAACGGIAMFRVAAIQQAGGYADAVAAGEEPDLCLRMRGHGWHIIAVGTPMGTHDAGLLHFGQWWQRARRAGHAYAEHVARHGDRADPAWRRQLSSIMAWGGALPLTALLLALVSPWLAVMPVALWCAQVGRIGLREWRGGARLRDAFEFAVMTMIAKFAQLIGIGDFRLRSR